MCFSVFVGCRHKIIWLCLVAYLYVEKQWLRSDKGKLFEIQNVLSKYGCHTALFKIQVNDINTICSVVLMSKQKKALPRCNRRRPRWSPKNSLKSVVLVTRLVSTGSLIDF